ncbi:MAG TPA: hypothetical protein VLA73_10320 [Burkholderiales bacterium]|nr:hypothetical protein [Burkholderiales bacterium]
MRSVARAAAALALVALTGEAAERPINPKLLDLPAERWIEIHRQRPGDPVVFRRQAHGGSAFDSKRGRLVLFGSDTHGVDWTNSPLYFDLASLAWTRAYPDDDPSTYRVSNDGIPIAGTGAPHPWAMHTFAAVSYDALNDRLVVASYPQHLEPGRFTDALAHVWPEIRRHPTWLFDLESQRWRALDSPAEHFFPYATAYDSHRAAVVGYRSDGIYELDMDRAEPRWRYRGLASHGGYHINAVYDSKRRHVIVAGSHRWSNDIVIYNPGTRRDRIMPTRGQRPPKFQHAPMAFHERKAVAVVLVDRLDESGPRQAETWVYDPGADAWSRVERASLPFNCGMNYNMHYDPLHDALLLVADAQNGLASVWALKLR